MKQVIVNEYMSPNGHVDVSSLREDLYDYLNTLHYMLSDTEFDEIARFARNWINEHLESADAFESSVRAKAFEISSGDNHNDYYRALLMRRDQLLAARDVFREYTRTLRDIFGEDRDSVLSNLGKFDFDSGIYLRALEYHTTRDQALQIYSDALEQEVASLDSILETEGEVPVKKSRATRSKTTTSTKTKPAAHRFYRRNI